MSPKKKTATKPAHTPGPWRVEWPTNPDAMSEVFAPSFDAYPWRVAYVMRDSNKHQRPIDDANAHLIAAAPELLDACKEALLWFGPDGDHIGEPWRALLLAAIAKAEGRT